jgi:hypothetical protein
MSISRDHETPYHRRPFHFRIHWFRWLIEEAPTFDLVCIARDLLDMFKFETRIEQSREIAKLIRGLADRVPVAVCCGNHDNAGSIAVLRFPDKPGYRGWFFITLRPRMVRVSAVRNWKPRNFSRHIEI